MRLIACFRRALSALSLVRALLLGALMAGALAACGVQQQSAQTVDSGEDTTTEAAPPPAAQETRPPANEPVQAPDQAAPAPPPPADELSGAKQAEQPATRSLRRSAPRARSSAQVELPNFPWPPPTPSARFVLQRTLFPSARTEFDVGDRLTRALDQAGYSEYSFYRAPGGFALVARLERMREDGSSAPGDLRFLDPNSSEPFSLGNYIQRLFFAPEGFYRQIVFVTTDKPFTTNPDDTLTSEEAAQLLRRGANRLPDVFRTYPFTTGHRVTALVYEFRKGAADRDVTTLDPGRLAGRTHLERAGILAALQHPQ